MVKKINGYETPVAEVVALEIEGAILNGSRPADNDPWGEEEI